MDWSSTVASVPLCPGINRARGSLVHCVARDVWPRPARSTPIIRPRHHRCEEFPGRVSSCACSTADFGRLRHTVLQCVAPRRRRLPDAAQAEAET